MVEISYAIVAANHDSGAEAPDCRGSVYSARYNLLGTTAGCQITGDVTTDVVSPDPGLLPLGDNGGSTLTHALKPTSPAIDAGNPAAPGNSNACPPTDQRG